MYDAYMYYRVPSCNDLDNSTMTNNDLRNWNTKKANIVMSSWFPMCYLLIYRYMGQLIDLLVSTD